MFRGGPPPLPAKEADEQFHGSLFKMVLIGGVLAVLRWGVENGMFSS